MDFLGTVDTNVEKDIVKYRCGFCHKEISRDKHYIIMKSEYKILMCDVCRRLVLLSFLVKPDVPLETIKNVYGDDLLKINNEEGDK